MRKPFLMVAVAMLAAVVTVSMSGGMLWAQTAPATTAPAKLAPATPTTGETPAVSGKVADLWGNFIYDIMIARFDMAESYGKAIVAVKPDPKEIYQLWMSSKEAGAVLQRGKAQAALAPIIDQVQALIDEGAKAFRTDPAEITRWIDALAGNPRQFMEAKARLENAGEYAAPQLVSRLMDSKTSEDLRAQIVAILPKLGKDAVRPLVEALQVKDPVVQAAIARALGKIGYPQAAPYLKQLAETKGVQDDVRQVATNALMAVDPRAAKKPVAELFFDLAVRYYRGDESLMPDSRYESANIWQYNEGLGVVPVAVPTPIFNEVYAMRCARLTLQNDPNFSPAVSLWLASDLRRQLQLPPGAKDATVTAETPSAEFYALASGAKYMQQVLKMAVDEKDGALALAAIKSLSQTAGADQLVAAVEGGVQPVVAALAYPARPVRYLAAEALVTAAPQKKFLGDNMVVPALLEALRQSGTPVALLADPNAEHRNKVKDLLRGAGMNVVDADSIGMAMESARTLGGADLAVIAGNVVKPNITESVRLLRGAAGLAAIPVIIVTSPADAATAREAADKAVVCIPDEKLDAAALAQVIKDVSAKASGDTALTPEQSAEWAVKAAGYLGLLAQTRNPVFDLTSAPNALMAATKDKRENISIAAAKALSQFKLAAAQQALADLAGDAATPENVRLAAYDALANSVRHFGNDLTEKQAKAVIEAVNAKGAGKLRDAAAGVLGALNLPSAKINELILSAP